MLRQLNRSHDRNATRALLGSVVVPSCPQGSDGAEMTSGRALGESLGIPVKATRVCDECGEAFDPSGRGGGRRRTCSPLCATNIRKKPIQTSGCPRCGEPATYRASAPRLDKYCSPTCYQETRTETRRAWAKAEHRARSPERQVQIRERGRERHRERYRTETEYRARYLEIARRRRFKDIMPFAPMWLEQNGKCYLCGGQMNPVSVRLGRTHDPLVATLEHRIPLSRGGTHTRENVSLAHYRCNSQKSTRTVAEYEAMRAA